MLLNVVLSCILLLAPVVLAVPSGLGVPIARRDGVVFTSNWAGAVLTEPNGTFSTVTGTFTVPTPSGSEGASAAAWVGIDGNTCTSASLQTGIRMIPGGPPIYHAFYYALDGYHEFTNISISAGDDIKLSVAAWSPNSGTVTIENLTNGQLVSKSLDSSPPLCGQNAEWIVQDYSVNGTLVPLADFGTVKFTNAVATTYGTSNYYPSDATILDITQNNQVLTSVTTNGASVTIQYV